MKLGVDTNNGIKVEG